jgi:hypothetical protein
MNNDTLRLLFTLDVASLYIGVAILIMTKLIVQIVIIEVILIILLMYLSSKIGEIKEDVKNEG